MAEFNVEVGKKTGVKVLRSGSTFVATVLSYEKRGRGESKYANLQIEGGVKVVFPVTAIEEILLKGE